MARLLRQVKVLTVRYFVGTDPIRDRLASPFHDHSCPSCKGFWEHDDIDCDEGRTFECPRCIKASRDVPGALQTTEEESDEQP